MRFSWKAYWGGLPFPPPVDHVLSEISTMTRLSGVALHGMTHGFIELSKPLCYNRAVICEEGIHCLYNSLNLPSPSSHSILPPLQKEDPFAMTPMEWRQHWG